MPKQVWIATAGAGLLWASLGTVLLLEENVFGVRITDWLLAPLLFVGLGVVHLVLRTLQARGFVARKSLTILGALCLLAVLSLFAIDTAYAVYRNLGDDGETRRAHQRLNDPRLWMGEAIPRWYEPTPRNFRQHKTGVSFEADVYGAFYSSGMLESPTLAQSVLELRPVDYTIDAHGFRDTTPIEDARYFALGDSFAFGYAVGQDAVWTEQVEALTGVPYYNLGVSSTSPGQQVRLLSHVLESHGSRISVEHLVWMIFEGNDLEESYLEWSYVAPSAGSALDGTVLESLRQIPRSWKYQSVIHRLRSGDIVVRGRGGAEGPNPYVVDGVAIDFPLYRSERHGPRLFHPDDLERAQRPRDYVLEHPHWPLLRAAFERMGELAAERGFPVTVVLAPSAARLHGPQFEGFPTLSEEPHFLMEVAGLAQQQSFPVVDLHALLEAPAKAELLYFRDDHHWNERGNRVVAELLAERLHREPRIRPVE